MLLPLHETGFFLFSPIHHCVLKHISVVQKNKAKKTPPSIHQQHRETTGGANVVCVVCMLRHSGFSENQKKNRRRSTTKVQPATNSPTNLELFWRIRLKPTNRTGQIRFCTRLNNIARSFRASDFCKVRVGCALC
jgi:hypothetical protein